jgi:threonine aldolase
MRYTFASDNTSGICPEAMQALEECNAGYLASYGNDASTAKAADLFREVFETDCEVFFVFNGTAANSLALASLCQSYHSVICHESAHVETDECGAPEFFTNGTKLLLAPGDNGKLDPVHVSRLVTKRSDIHYPRPNVLSLTLPSEVGTVYSLEELRALHEVAARHRLKIHMDGSRFANAVASRGDSPADLTWRSNVDVLCCGGTKLGVGLGEAVIFFNKALANEFDYRCKQAGQLASKMRFLAAPWCATLRDGTWLRNAENANACARLLAERISHLAGVRKLYPVEANSVFLELPQTAHDYLKAKGWAYYVFIGGGARFMCSWATTPADVADLAADIADAVQSSPGS